MSILCMSTFKVESLIPPWVESSSLNLCLQPVFLIRQKGYPHIGVTQPIHVTGYKVSTLMAQIVGQTVRVN